MAQSLNTVAASSDDPQVLLDAAAAAAANKEEAEHTVLRRFLVDQAFLSRLDSEDDYAAPPHHLRLARILKTLMDNRCPAADSTLVRLTQDSGFVSIEARQELLIRALVVVRPSPPEVIAFWRLHSRPTAPYKHVAMDVMADNASEPALQLFEQVMVEPAQEREYKIAWMRDPILRNRLTPTVLIACERMLTKSLPPDLRPDLVAALFDHREEWYLSCDPPIPPDIATIQPPANVILERIAVDALANVPLDARTTTAVEAALTWLRK